MMVKNIKQNYQTILFKINVNNINQLILKNKL